MELLIYPKTEYLLDASLETLHSESVEWKSELDFWGDEMTFFYKLLHVKESKKAFPAKDLAEAEKELIKLNGDRLDKIKAEVSHHERLLSSAIKYSSSADEQVYRATHRKIMIDMHSLYLEIKTFKRNIFSFVEKFKS